MHTRSQISTSNQPNIEPAEGQFKNTSQAANDLVQFPRHAPFCQPGLKAMIKQTEDAVKEKKYTNKQTQNLWVVNRQI